MIELDGVSASYRSGFSRRRRVILNGIPFKVPDRLGLAQAILHSPRMLVLDEPLTGLDPMGRLALREIIARQHKAGVTVFFSSHILSDVEAVCDHIVILDAGKIAYQGSVEQL